MVNPALSGLLSAATHGVGDVLSGLASRRDPPLRVVALTHPLSALALLGLAWALGQPVPDAGALGWGAGAGLAGLGAVLAFYRALALGPMGAVSVGAGALSALVPVVVGVLGGEVLGVWSWLGAAAVLAGTALLGWPVSGPSSGRGTPLGLLAGVGFGVFFVLLAQAQGGGVLWVLGAARVASSLAALPLAASSLAALPLAAATVGLRPRGPGLILASAPGDTLGNLFYLLAVQAGPLAVGALLTSLYPAITTLLAVTVLREQLRAPQWVGVALALGGAALLAGP